MVKHSPQCDVRVRILDVAYVPCVRFNLFSLHAVMLICPVTLDSHGAHLLDGQLSFIRKDVISDVDATRTVETPMLPLVWPPENAED